MNVWVLFTNNLRIRDNTVLDAACQNSNTVFPIYHHDTQLSQNKELWQRDIWAFRATFLCQSIRDLRNNLEWKKSHLSIIHSEWRQGIINYALQHSLSKIYMQRPVWEYEIRYYDKLSQQLKKHGISLYQIWDHTLVYKDDIPFDINQMPQVFTQFRKSVEKSSHIEAPLKTPKINSKQDIASTAMLNLKDDFWYESIQTDERAYLNFQWWETAAWERLGHYFWESKSLSEYKNTRNGLIWADYSSKFSPWLANWCISPRSIYSEVKKYEKDIKKNSSTYWLIFELLWRDFFQFIFLQDSVRFFKKYPKSEETILSSSQKRKFEQWKSWTLWVDFVDANMRELSETGFMSNRGRQIVASYLVNDLKIDWRLWAKYFENMLIDYDIASNWWNWAYVAWVWNDPRDNRYFNIEKQANMYDSKWEYRKLWLH